MPQDSSCSISEHELVSPVDSHKRGKVPCHISLQTDIKLAARNVLFVTGWNWENQRPKNWSDPFEKMSLN